MSYELVFWRYKPGVNPDHLRVYNSLCDGAAVDELEQLHTERMVDRVGVVFSDWQKLDDLTFDGGDRGGFQLSITPQSIRVDCYGMEGEDMNQLIEIAHEFGCPLFDPQAGKRFDSPDTA
jgi:hypothetical protein